MGVKIILKTIEISDAKDVDTIKVTVINIKHTKIKAVDKPKTMDFVERVFPNVILFILILVDKTVVQVIILTITSIILKDLDIVDIFSICRNFIKAMD